MRHYKLNTDERRRWRQNRLVLVDAETTEPYRYATDDEVRQHQEAHSKGLPIRFEGDDGKSLRIMEDREVFAEQILKSHGSVEIRDVNGRFMRRIISKDQAPHLAYDPNQVRLGAPEPSKCVCASWEGRTDGKHHERCEYDKMAPPGQQSLKRSDSVAIRAPRTIRNVPNPPRPVAGVSPSPMGVVRAGSNAPTIPHPASCVCREWGPQNDGESHHPICEWYDRWEAAKPKTKVETQAPSMEVPSSAPNDEAVEEATHDLCNMKREPVRDALSFEVVKAAENFKMTGVPSVIISGQEWLVIAKGGTAETQDTELPPPPETDGKIEIAVSYINDASR